MIISKILKIFAVAALAVIALGEVAQACDVQVGRPNSCDTQYRNAWRSGQYGRGGPWNPNAGMVQHRVAPMGQPVMIRQMPQNFGGHGMQGGQQRSFQQFGGQQQMRQGGIVRQTTRTYLLRRHYYGAQQNVQQPVFERPVVQQQIVRHQAPAMRERYVRHRAPVYRQRAGVRRAASVCGTCAPNPCSTCASKPAVNVNAVANASGNGATATNIVNVNNVTLAGGASVPLAPGARPAPSVSGWSNLGKHPLCEGKPKFTKFQCTSPTSGNQVECMCD